MKLPAELPPAGATAPTGLLRAASRWVVVHPKWTAILVALWVGALCVGQWWLAFQQAEAWQATHPGQPVPFRWFDASGWAFIGGVGIWLALWAISGTDYSKRPAGANQPGAWCFAARERQRIFEGRPISPRWLWVHALFGLLGFALGVGVLLKLVTATAWQIEVLSDNRGQIWLVVIAILVALIGAQRIRDVLFLADCDYFVGDRREEFAEAVAEEEQAEAEAERDYERKKIYGWAYVVFMGGLIGGLGLFYKLLPETEGTMAFSGSISGLLASVAVVYQRRMKPKHGLLWTGVALMASAAFLVFTCVSWQRPVLYALLGVPSGVMVGVASTLLYFRRLRRMQSRDDDGTHPSSAHSSPKRRGL